MWFTRYYYEHMRIMTPEQLLTKEIQENSAKLTVLIGLERQTQEALKRIGKVVKKTADRLADLDEIVVGWELERLKKVVAPLIDKLPPFPLAR